MHSLHNSFQITSRGLRYALIYLLFIILPFFWCLGKIGMGYTVGKTLGYLSQPILLIAWLSDLNFFHENFYIISSANIIINIFILLWLGALIEEKSEDIIMKN